MSAYVDKCPNCGREFTNYDDLRANRTFCSVGCQVDAGHPMSERQFPVLFGGDSKLYRQLGCPRTVPWSWLAPHEAMALSNHDQPLERLAERGGLDPEEMFRIVDGERLFCRPFTVESKTAAVERLKALFSTAGTP